MDLSFFVMFWKLWAFGLITLGFIFGFPALYALRRMVQVVGSKIEREPGPKDMWQVKMIIFAVVGFVLGGLAQGWFDGYTMCRMQGYQNPACLFAALR